MVKKLAKNFKRVGLYCAEKNFRTGNGRLGRTINTRGLTVQQVKDKIFNMKSDQKKKNKLFRVRLKANKKKLVFDDETQQVLEASKDPIAQRENIPEIEVEKDITVQVNEERKIPKGIRVLDKLNLKLDKGTGNTTYLLGSSKRGKSSLMMHIFKKYYNKKNFITTLFSINSQIPLYKSSKSLIKIDNFGHDAQRYIKMEQVANKKCKNKYNWANLIDDVIDIRQNTLINNMILTYRNSKISSVICLQYSNLLSKQSRSNINNVICFGFNTDEAIEVVIKIFLKGAFNKLGIRGLDEQIAFYRKMTMDHGFIYIHPESGTISFHKLSMKTLNEKK